MTNKHFPNSSGNGIQLTNLYIVRKLNAALDQCDGEIDQHDAEDILKKPPKEVNQALQESNIDTSDLIQQVLKQVEAITELDKPKAEAAIANKANIAVFPKIAPSQEVAPSWKIPISKLQCIAAMLILSIMIVFLYSNYSLRQEKIALYAQSQDKEEEIAQIKKEQLASKDVALMVKEQEQTAFLTQTIASLTQEKLALNSELQRKNKTIAALQETNQIPKEAVDNKPQQAAKSEGQEETTQLKEIAQLKKHNSQLREENMDAQVTKQAYEEVMNLVASNSISLEAPDIHALSSDRCFSEKNKKVVTLVDKLAPLLPPLSDNEKEATKLNNLGVFYFSNGNYEKALSYYEKALTEIRVVGKHSREATTLNNLGMVYSIQSRYTQQKAIDYYNQALSLRQSMGDKKGQAETLRGLGLAFCRLGKFQQAIDYYNQALLLKQTLDDTKGEADILNNLGLAYSELKDNTKALSYYEKALPLLQKIDEPKAEASILNNLGTAYQDLKQLDNALRYYEKALALRQELDDKREEAITLSNIGSVYQEMKNYDQVIEYYKKVLPIRRQLEDRQTEAKTLNILGVAYFKLKNYQEAIQCYEKALEIMPTDNKQDRIVFLSNIGKAYEAAGDKQKADSYYEQRNKLKD